MKTPIQELMEWMKDNRHIIMIHIDPLSLVNDQCEHLLEKEKQAIIRSCVHGASSLTFTKQHEIECGVDYYKSTYGK